MNLRDMHEMCKSIHFGPQRSAKEPRRMWPHDRSCLGALSAHWLAQTYKRHDQGEPISVTTEIQVRLLTLWQNVNLFMSTFGPHPDQLHGYPGHPELELAMLRLFAVTRDPRHLDFARYLLEERGQKREDQSEMTYFDWEAKERRMNLVYGHHMASWDDQT